MIILKKATIFAICPQDVNLWLRQRNSIFSEEQLPKFYTTSNLNFIGSNDDSDNYISKITLRIEVSYSYRVRHILRNTPEDGVS